METGPHALFARSITRWADKELRTIDAVGTLSGPGTRNPISPGLPAQVEDAGAAVGTATSSSAAGTATSSAAGEVEANGAAGRAAGRAMSRRDDMHLVLQRIFAIQERAKADITQQEELQSVLDARIAATAAFAAMEIPKARGEEREVCNAEVSRNTHERTGLAQTLAVAELRKCYAQREHDDLLDVHDRLSREAGEAKMKVDYELPIIACLQGDHASLTTEKQVATSRVDHARQALDEALAKDKGEQEEQMAKIVETQTALEETQKEIAAVEEEKAVRPDYEGEIAKLEPRIEKLRIQNRRKKVELTRKKDLQKQMSIEINNKTQSLEKWQGNYVRELEAFKQTMATIEDERKVLAKQEADADQRRRDAKAAVKAVGSECAEVYDSSRMAERENQHYKEADMQCQQEFHRLEVEMRKVAGQHKECKSEYDVTVLKQRRLEKSVGEKHDQHSDEEMLLEHYYREGLLKLKGIQEADEVKIAEIANCQAETEAMKFMYSPEQMFNRLAVEQLAAEDAAAAAVLERTGLGEVLKTLTPKLQTRKITLRANTDEHDAFAAGWASELNVLNVPIAALEAEIAGYDAVTAKLPVMTAAFTKELAEVQAATQVSLQRSEETRAEITGLEEQAAKIQLAIDELVAQAAAIKVEHVGLVAEAEATQLEHDQWVAAGTAEVKRVGVSTMATFKENPAVAAAYTRWRAVFLKTKSVLADTLSEFLRMIDRLRLVRQRQAMQVRVRHALEALHVEVDIQIREIRLEGEAAGGGGGEGVMSAGEVKHAVSLIAGRIRSLSSRRVRGIPARLSGIPT